MLTLKQIEYALAVAKNLHFKKAADECFISPSTLSNAISELEINLGFKIFERSNKKVIITSLGHAMLEKAKEVKLQVQDINEMRQFHTDALSYPVSIGIIPTISPYFLPIVLPKIQKKFPDLTLKIEESQSRVLVDRVQEGDLDMAILALPYNLGDLECFKFWQEDFYLVSSIKNKFRGKSEIRANELKHSELMLLEDGHCLKDHILDACNITSLSKHSLKASSLNTLIQLVRANLGSTLVPQMAINQLIGISNDLSISHLNEPGPHREICLITRKNYSGMKNIQLLYSVFRKEMKRKF